MLAKVMCGLQTLGKVMQYQICMYLGTRSQVSRGGRLLGAHVAYARKVRNTLMEKRVERGIVVADRVRWVPLPMPIRARLLSSLVVPAALYGACVGDIVLTQLNSLTSAVMRALWGTQRKLRCRDIVLTLFAAGHLVDPRQVCIYQSLCALRCHLQKKPELAYVVRNCWQACVKDGISAPGPVGTVHKHVLKIGWTWSEFETFGRIGRRSLPLLAGPDAWWKHEVRDGIRLSLWSDAAARRKDMEGLQAVQGIDRKATMSLHDSKLPPKELGLLRGLLAGSIRLQKRLHDASLVPSPTCPFCGLCDESLRHCFWECPRWDSIRMNFTLPCIDVRALWPACTTDCGTFIEDSSVIDLAAQLQQEECAAKNIVEYFSCRECRSRVTASHDVNEQQTLWTDGAASNNQDDRFRRAGFGIYYDDGHNLNLSALLPGLQQTNQRAELLAVVVACLRDPRPLDIRSDSEYVCEGFSRWMFWADSGWAGDHADLWNLLANELRARTSAVHVSWVKGHAKRIDILRGRTTEEDKRGNDGADGLAVDGANLHPVSPEVLDSARHRKTCAVQVQRMMVTVLQARFQAEGENKNVAENADRGSDFDCMEYDDSNDEEDIAHRSDLSVGVAPLEDYWLLSGSHASANEPACACASNASLHDECDEGVLTYDGVVQ